MRILWASHSPDAQKAEHDCRKLLSMQSRVKLRSKARNRCEIGKWRVPFKREPALGVLELASDVTPFQRSQVH